MKISFVLGPELPFPPGKGGGVNSLLDGLTVALASLGHEVTAYSPTVDGRPNFEVVNGVTHVRIKGIERKKSNFLNAILGVSYALKLKRAIKECDILSCHLFQGFFFTKMFSKATVVTHTIHRDPKKFLNLFLFMDRIYTGTDSITEDAIKVVPRLATKIKTVYNCVDFSKYPMPSSKPRNGKIHFIFVGRFSSDKGLKSFIEGFCEAAHLNKDIFFTSVGPLTFEGGGEEQLVSDMEQLVTNQGLDERVNFLKPIYERDRLDELIRGTDVIVLPSISGETLNMSILECMRLGKALLISDLSANAPLNLEAKTGYFVKAGDANNWKLKILEMASNIENIENFGRNTYNYGFEKFSTIQIASEYVKDFTKLIESKTKQIAK